MNDAGRALCGVSPTWGDGTPVLAITCVLEEGHEGSHQDESGRTVWFQPHHGNTITKSKIEGSPDEEAS